MGVLEEGTRVQVEVDNDINRRDEGSFTEFSQLLPVKEVKTQDSNGTFTD